MNNKKRVVFSFLFVILVFYCLNGIYASDNLENDNLTAISDDNLTTISEEDMTSIDNEDATLSEGEYVPDSNGIYVSPDGDDNDGNGSYSNPFQTIKKGFARVKEGRTIYLAGGTYNIDSEIVIFKNQITVSSYDGNSPIIDGQNKSSLLSISGNPTFTFKGITFANGYAENGGVLNFLNYNQFKGTFYNCTFINNTAANNGGVFYVSRNNNAYSMSDSLNLISCSFYNNSATTGSIYYGGSNTFSSLTMEYCVAFGNTNYAVYSAQNRDGLLTENYWGTNNDLDKVVSYAGGDVQNAKLTLICDNEAPTVDDKVIFTAKIVSSSGDDFSSSIHIPQIPITFQTTTGNLTITSSVLVNSKSQTILSISEVGLLTVSVDAYGYAVNKTVTVFPSPLYVSANAINGEGDGSFNNPYTLKDAIEAVNNGAINILKFFEGVYEFNERYRLNTNATICAYSTPYGLDDVSITANNGFLTLSPNIHALVYNITLSNSKTDSLPLFDILANSTLDLTNMVILTESVIADVGSNSYLNIEFSQIINQTSTYLFNNNGEITANNNWWGANAGFNSDLVFGNEINATKWFVLSQSQEKSVLRTEWPSIFTISLTDNENNSISDYLPAISLIFSTDTGNLDFYQSNLNLNNSYSISNKISEVMDEACILTIADNEMLQTIFEYDVPLTEIFLSPDGSDEGDGSFEKPFLTVLKALDRAKESNATIYFLKGKYDLNITFDGIKYIANRNLSFSSYNGLVELDRTNRYFLAIFNSTTNIVIDGISLTNGIHKFANNEAITSYGNLTVKNSFFTNNTGGGLSAYISGYGNAKIYVYNCSFTSTYPYNYSYTNPAIFGAADTYVHVSECSFDLTGFHREFIENNAVLHYNTAPGPIDIRGTADILNCNFTNNNGGIRTYYGKLINVVNCSFINTSGRVALDISTSKFYVANCTFINNTAGVISSTQKTEIINSSFYNNSAISGGAIKLTSADAVISNCYFEGNNASDGGTVYNSYSYMLIEHCEFNNSVATNRGGAIYTEGTDDYIEIQYNVFANCKANIGGVIYNDGITSLFNNLMSESVANNGSYIYNNNRIGNTYLKILDQNNSTCYNGEPVVIYASLTDDMANPISGGNVTFIFDNKEINATSEEGVASINHVFEKEGTYIIDGNYSGSRRYVVVVGQASISIVKKPTKIIAENMSGYYPFNRNLTIILNDIDGKAVSNATIFINIAGQTYRKVTDNEGSLSHELNLSECGQYHVEVNFYEDDYHASSSASSIISMISTINANNRVRGYNSGVDFKAGLLTSNGTPLSNTSVSIFVNGREYVCLTDSQGGLILNMKLNVGEYSVKLINPINNEIKLVSLNIVKRIVGNSDLKVDYSSGSKFKVRVVGDNGNYVGAGEVVTFKINGKTITAKTDRNGYAYLTISQIPKTYTIAATYKGFTTSNKITVNQIINAKNVKVKKSAGKLKIKVALKKVNGKYSKGKKITIRFKGNKYVAKTNKKGIATFTLKRNVLRKLKSGKKYKYTATYIKSSVSKKIIVKK